MEGLVSGDGLALLGMETLELKLFTAGRQVGEPRAESST